MAESRALLTDTERRRIAGDGEDQRRYEAISRVRARIRDEFAEDVATLAEHNEDLYTDLRDVVVAVDQDRRDELIIDEPAVAHDASTPSNVDLEDARPGLVDVRHASGPVGEDSAPREQASSGDESASVEWRELDLPGSGGTLEQRQDAVRELYEYLQDEGHATAAEMQDLVWAKTGYASERSAWKNCLFKGLKQVAEQDSRLHAPGEGEHTWRYGEQ